MTMKIIIIIQIFSIIVLGLMVDQKNEIIYRQAKIISADLIAMQSAEKQLASALVICKKVEDLERKLWDARK